MNENIDLTKILEKCPVGTKLYSSTHGIVTLQTIECNKITVLDYRYCPIDYSKKGYYCPHIYGNGECTIFPSKDQRDWSKFERFWDKPKVERFDLKTLQPFDKVLVRENVYDFWRAVLFSHIYTPSHRAECNSMLWKECVPYNKETKHLVGTTEDCPEYYKWWEE